MSTSSQHLPPPSGSAPPIRGNWGRNGEPGAAFRGLSRGRRGAGDVALRRARGGRGGGTAPRGIKGTGTGDNINSQAKVDEPVKPTLPVPPTSSAEKPSTSATSAKPKNIPRRASRSIPTLVINPASSNPETSSVTPSNRRKRSQQHNKSDKRAPPVERNPLRTTRSHSGPTSPVAPPKDIPPHLVASAVPEITSFDMRTNIDALVERVRAVAMAENRPTTPGSHIDWAGDDDDSLPDLNDWGVTTGAANKDETISPPISVDSLKHLPDTGLESMSSSIMEETAGPSSVADDDATTHSVESVPRSEKSSREEREHSKHLGQAPRTLQLNGTDEPKLTTNSAPATRPSERELSPSWRPLNEAMEPRRTPLHPSLPPKPVAAVESLSKPRIDVKSVRAAETLTLATSAETPVVKLSSRSLNTLDHPEIPAQDAAMTRAAEEGAAQTSSSVIPSQKIKDVNVVDGLAASIHAPKGLVKPSSAPSDIAAYGTSSTVSTGFNPTHNRASTVGRLPLPQPHTAPVVSLPGSGSSTPRRRFGSPPEGHHTRTHSTPPSGHRMLHTRPVITGDAISRLARTLLPSRTVDVSASKE